MITELSQILQVTEQEFYSTYESSNTAYNSITGTSMASPNVAGSLLILQEHANNVFGDYIRAATLKGIALHDC